MKNINNKKNTLKLSSFPYLCGNENYNLFLALHLLLVSLLPNNNIFELQKLGNLLLHFEHHLTVHKKNIDFIALNYFNSEHQQKDHAEHEYLPFHQHENTPITKKIFYAPQIVFEVVAIFATFIPEKTHSFFL